jgi:hypothetical protein
MDPRQSTEDILQCLFHPYFHNSQCEQILQIRSSHKG